MKIECPRFAENAPVTQIKGKDLQGEEEKGVINEGNRLIIDIFHCMFSHGSLISYSSSIV